MAGSRSARRTSAALAGVAAATLLHIPGSASASGSVAGVASASSALVARPDRTHGSSSPTGLPSSGTRSSSTRRARRPPPVCGQSSSPSGTASALPPTQDIPGADLPQAANLPDSVNLRQWTMPGPEPEPGRHQADHRLLRRVGHRLRDDGVVLPAPLRAGRRVRPHVHPLAAPWPGRQRPGHRHATRRGPRDVEGAGHRHPCALRRRLGLRLQHGATRGRRQDPERRPLPHLGLPQAPREQEHQRPSASQRYQIKAALAAVSPVAISVRVREDFSTYGRGVYRAKGVPTGLHVKCWPSATTPRVWSSRTHGEGAGAGRATCCWGGVRSAVTCTKPTSSTASSSSRPSRTRLRRRSPRPATRSRPAPR